jgi:hypothetical protein
MGIKEFVLDRERRIGFREGLEQARLENLAMNGKKHETTFIKNLFTHTDFSDEKIASIAGVEIAFVKEMRTSL